MSYKDTFIAIAPDSTATEAVIPPDNRAQKTIHLIQYELLTEKPYHYTHEDLVFTVHAIRKNISDPDLAENGDAIHADFFKKEHPCLRASALTKKYDWGVHHNADRKIALYPIESDDYATLADQSAVKLVAMRSSRKK